MKGNRQIGTVINGRIIIGCLSFAYISVFTV